LCEWERMASWGGQMRPATVRMFTRQTNGSEWRCTSDCITALQSVRIRARTLDCVRRALHRRRLRRRLRRRHAAIGPGSALFPISVYAANAAHCSRCIQCNCTKCIYTGGESSHIEWRERFDLPITMLAWAHASVGHAWIAEAWISHDIPYVWIPHSWIRHARFLDLRVSVG